LISISIIKSNKNARLGLIQHITGIDSVYETPSHPEISIDAKKERIDQGVFEIISLYQLTTFLSKLNFHIHQTS